MTYFADEAQITEPVTRTRREASTENTFKRLEEPRHAKTPLKVDLICLIKEVFIIYVRG